MLVLPVFLLFAYGCVNGSIGNEPRFSISAGDEIVLKRLLSGSDIPVASSKEIFSTVINELENNVGKNTEDLVFDLLAKHKYSGDYFTVIEGVRVIITEIEGEYAKMRILDGRHIGKVVWTYARYLESRMT
jgi:hypothetical protein